MTNSHVCTLYADKFLCIQTIAKIFLCYKAFSTIELPTKILPCLLDRGNFVRLIWQLRAGKEHLTIKFGPDSWQLMNERYSVAIQQVTPLTTITQTSCKLKLSDQHGYNVAF